MSRPGAGAAAQAYGDAVHALDEAGVPAVLEDTGGGCLALYCRLEGGRYLLVTDVGDPLSGSQSVQEGWGVGLYLDEGEPDDPESYRYTYEKSAEGLVELVRETLTRRPDQC